MLIQILHKWHFSKINSQACLAGEISGERVYIPFADIERILPKRMIFMTLYGNSYQLDDVDPEYEQRFPNAKECFKNYLCPKDTENSEKTMIT